jgi:hypothetical protein
LHVGKACWNELEEKLGHHPFTDLYDITTIQSLREEEEAHHPITLGNFFSELG